MQRLSDAEISNQCLPVNTVPKWVRHLNRLLKAKAHSCWTGHCDLAVLIEFISNQLQYSGQLRWYWRTWSCKGFQWSCKYFVRSRKSTSHFFLHLQFVFQPLSLVPGVYASKPFIFFLIALHRRDVHTIAPLQLNKLFFNYQDLISPNTLKAIIFQLHGSSARQRL